MTKSNKTLARQLALQAIFQWQFTDDSITDIELQFNEDHELSKQLANADKKYFTVLLHNVITKVDELDRHIEAVLDRPKENLTPVELAALRIAVYELAHQLKVPYKVVINEALQLTKAFGATDGHKYVNGVLDKIARRLRPIEIKS